MDPLEALNLLIQVRRSEQHGYCPCHTCAMRNRMHTIDSLAEREAFMKAGMDSKMLFENVENLSQNPVEQIEAACELLESVGCKEEADIIRIMMEPQEKIKLALVKLEEVKQQRVAAQPKITV